MATSKEATEYWETCENKTVDESGVLVGEFMDHQTTIEILN